MLQNVLEIFGIPAILHLLPDDENQDFQAERSDPDGGKISKNPLESAIDFIGRNAGTTGEEPFDRRQRIAMRQLTALLQWGRNRSFLLNGRIWEGKAKIGGSEHDIWDVRRPNVENNKAGSFRMDSAARR